MAPVRDVQTGTSADASTAITFAVHQAHYRHTVVATTTGTVSAGTLAITGDGQAATTAIDLTAPVPKVFTGNFSEIVFTPGSYAGSGTTTYSVTLTSQLA